MTLKQELLLVSSLAIATSAILKGLFCLVSSQHFLGNHTKTDNGVSRIMGTLCVLSISADMVGPSIVSNDDRDSSKVYNMALVRKLFRYGTAALYFFNVEAPRPRADKKENDSYP